MNPLKSLAKRLFGSLVAEYRINFIYAADQSDLPAGEVPLAVPESAEHRAALAVSRTDKMRGSQSYARAGLAGLVIAEHGTPLSVAHFAEPAQYDRQSTWPLRPGEVALMDIATEDAARGRGLAGQLIRSATRHYLAQGHQRLIAFIWWSNRPSLRAFEKAGWKRIGYSLEVRPRTRWFSLRLRRPFA